MLDSAANDAGPECADVKEDVRKLWHRLFVLFCACGDLSPHNARDEDVSLLTRLGIFDIYRHGLPLSA